MPHFGYLVPHFYIFRHRKKTVVGCSRWATCLISVYFLVFSNSEIFSSLLLILFSYHNRLLFIFLTFRRKDLKLKSHSIFQLLQMVRLYVLPDIKFSIPYRALYIATRDTNINSSSMCHFAKVYKYILVNTKFDNRMHKTWK